MHTWYFRGSWLESCARATSWIDVIVVISVEFIGWRTDEGTAVASYFINKAEYTWKISGFLEKMEHPTVLALSLKVECQGIYSILCMGRDDHFT